MKINKFHFCVFFLLITTSILAQKQQRKNILDVGDVPFRNELYLGGGVHTGGWNINLNYALIKKPMRTMSFLVEFGELKNPKEQSKTFENISLTGKESKAFVYGKRNSLFVARVGYGEKLYLSSKENKRTISLAWTYSGGISLGLIKPYYLNLIYRSAGSQPSIRSEKYSASNITKFLNSQEVDGPTGSAKGWDEVALEPGFFVKTGVLVDWGAFDEVVKGFEVGLSMDTYFSRIPMMVFEENTPIFLNLYFHIYLGKRW